MTHALSPIARKMFSLILLAVTTLVNIAAATEPGIFTVVLLPDTQFYSETYPATYVAQTEWIRARRKADNIRFVIHLGDIVQNAMVEEEWERADRAHQVLDGDVPYSVLPGNHDLDLLDGKLTRGATMYDKYFGPQRFTAQPWYHGNFQDSNANNYCVFEASGLKFLVLSLEYAPRDAAIEWATKVLEAHKDHRVIVATHYYMQTDRRAQGTSLEGHIGDGLWDRLIRKYANIFMVVSGHISGVYHQTSTNDAGGVVHEILCDYQNQPHGGDGWLQTLRFVPAENEIYVDAYSPRLEKVNQERGHTYKITYPMDSRAKRQAN